MKRTYLSLRRGRSADERGATLIFTAICMVLLLWSGAMGVDIGFSVWGSRGAQAIADTGALDLARYLDIADAQVSQPNTESWLDTKISQVLTDNGSDDTLTAIPGRWASGRWSVPAACQSATPPIPMYCNAVMVTASQKVPQIFYGGFNTLSARSAIAANTPSVGFSIGTFLANLTTGSQPCSGYQCQDLASLNAILSPIGSANVTLVGYQGLATSYVTLNQMISADSTVLSPSNILSATLTPEEWASVLYAALGNQTLDANCNGDSAPSACEAYSALGPGGQLSVTGNQPIQLCQLVSINQTSSPPTASICSNTSVSPTGLDTSVNVMQMLTTMAEVADGAELANGSSAIDLTSALGITGVTSATLSLQVVQPPSLAYGPTGTKASTGQVDATLNIGLLGLNALTITLDGATGTATLENINCTDNSMNQTTIDASTTAASGSVSFLGSGDITASVTGASLQELTYSGGNVPPTPQTLANGYNPVELSTTSPTLTYSGLGSSSPAYAFLTGTFDSVMPSVLTTLGVTAGGAEVADLNTDCDAVSLVQ
jgi:uncharacterized membrane protein